MEVSLTNCGYIAWITFITFECG